MQWRSEREWDLADEERDGNTLKEDGEGESEMQV